MSGNSSAGKGKVLALFFVFIVLFILVFGLGVFVGKEFNKKEIRVIKKFEEPSRPSPPPPVDGNDMEMTKEIAAESEPVNEDGEKILEEEVAEEIARTEAPPTEETEKPAPEIKAEPARTEPPAEKVSEERLAKITEEIERKVKSEREEKKISGKNVTLPPVDPKGLYTVQIGSFQSQDEANKLASSMQSRGYPVFIKSMTTPDNKNWYRVRIGTFGNVDTAKNYGERLKAREPDVKIVFITVNN